MENERTGVWLPILGGIALWMMIASYWPKGFLLYLAIIIIVAGLAYPSRR